MVMEILNFEDLGDTGVVWLRTLAPQNRKQLYIGIVVSRLPKYTWILRHIGASERSCFSARDYQISIAKYLRGVSTHGYGSLHSSVTSQP